MNGTTTSAKRAMERRPPKMMMAVSTASPMLEIIGGRPKAPYMASEMELACTALKTKPKVSSKHSAKTTPSQCWPKPSEM